MLVLLSLGTEVAGSFPKRRTNETQKTKATIINAQRPFPLSLSSSSNQRNDNVFPSQDVQDISKASATNRTVIYRLIQAVPDPKLRVGFVVNGQYVCDLQFQEFFVGKAIQVGSKPLVFEAIDLSTNRSLGGPVQQSAPGGWAGIAIVLKMGTVSPAPPIIPATPYLEASLYDSKRFYSREPVVVIHNNIFNNNTYGFTNSSSILPTNASTSHYASPVTPILYTPDAPGRMLYVWLLNYDYANQTYQPMWVEQTIKMYTMMPFRVYSVYLLGMDTGQFPISGLVFDDYEQFQFNFVLPSSR